MYIYSALCLRLRRLWVASSAQIGRSSGIGSSRHCKSRKRVSQTLFPFLLSKGLRWLVIEETRQVAKIGVDMFLFRGDLHTIPQMKKMIDTQAHRLTQTHIVRHIHGYNGWARVFRRSSGLLSNADAFRPPQKRLPEGKVSPSKEISGNTSNVLRNRFVLHHFLPGMLSFADRASRGSNAR